jgi:hypothetical protein
MKLLQDSGVEIPIMTQFEHGQSIFLLSSLIVMLEHKKQTIKGQRIVIDGPVNHESNSLK